MITHHCRECGETVPAGGCVAHPAAPVDTLAHTAVPVPSPHAALITSAQALVGVEPGDRWERVAARVVYYDPHARPRDLADAIAELRAARDSGRP